MTRGVRIGRWYVTVRWEEIDRRGDWRAAYGLMIEPPSSREIVVCRVIGRVTQCEYLRDTTL
jgi:hypothetical protein